MTGKKLMKIFFYLSGREQINSRACMVSVAGGSKELLNFTDGPRPYSFSVPNYAH